MSAVAGRAPLVLLIAGLAPALCGCVQDLPPAEGLTSLRLILKSPKENELGTPDKPVSPAEALFDVQAIGPGGQLMTGDYETQAFLAAGARRLSLRSPCGGAAPDGGTGAPDWLLGTVKLTGGQAVGVRIPLTAPAIFGVGSLNLEEPRSKAIGATPPIYFPNPTIRRLMEPLDPDSKDATYCNAYLGRQVAVDTPAGRLVVSSVFQTGFTLTDSSEKDYSSIFVFTFSRPPTTLVKGRVVQRLAGAVAKFNGFSQIANPTLSVTDMVKPELVPKPVELTAAMRPKTPNNSAEVKALTKLIAAPVFVTAKVCDLSDSRRADNWNRYSTFVMTYDDNDGCNGLKTFSVALPGRGFAGFDPAVQAGKEITISGMLHNSANPSGSTLFWTIDVRETGDLCLKARAECTNVN